MSRFENCQPETVTNCNALKPVRCGCCGEAEIVKHTFHNLSPSYGVECTNCHTESWQFYNTEAEAIEAWNRAMSGNEQDCAKNARCKERTAKVFEQEPSGLPMQDDYMTKGFCENCEIYIEHRYKYCPGCGARLEWK